MVSLLDAGVPAANIDAGTLLAYLSFWEQGLNQGTPSDDAHCSLDFLDVGTNLLSTVITPTIDSHNLTWSNYAAYYPIPAGTRFIQYNMIFTRNVGSDLDAFIDDNVLAVTSAIQLPALHIATAGTNVLVFWPQAYSGGYLLQQNTNLASTNWVFSPLPVASIGDTNQVSVSPPLGNSFFRLYHP